VSNDKLLVRLISHGMVVVVTGNRGMSVLFTFCFINFLLDFIRTIHVQSALGFRYFHLRQSLTYNINTLIPLHRQPIWQYIWDIWAPIVNNYTLWGHVGPARTLESCVRIPLEAWMFAFILCMLSYTGSDLRRADPPIKESYRVCKMIRKLQKR
jgi:hypothetical protein